jgi:hypothetical protein
MRVRKSLAPVKRAGAREGGIARAGAGAKWRLLARARAERRAATRRTRANETRGIAVDARSDAKSEKRVRDGD